MGRWKTADIYAPEDDYEKKRQEGNRRVDAASQGLYDTVAPAVQARKAGMGMAKYGKQALQASMDRAVAARQQQQNAIALHRDAAMGKAPSAAQMMLTMQADQLAQQQMGMASGVRGAGQAAAMRNAGMMGTQARLQANQQAALLRAQEMQAGRQALTDALSGVRDQDNQAAGIGAGAAATGFDAAGKALGAQQSAYAKVGDFGQAEEQFYGDKQYDAAKTEAMLGVELEMSERERQNQRRMAYHQRKLAEKLGKWNAIGNVVNTGVQTGLQLGKMYGG